MTFPLTTPLPSSSRLIFGCMGLGGSWDDQPLSSANLSYAQAAVEAALAIGITLFDHADIYTLGKAEQAFGALFKQQPALRQQMLLQSKCGILFKDSLGPQRYDLSQEHILASVDASLQRLNTDYLDVLLLHRPDPLLHPAEIAEAWLKLKQAGKVRHLGVSNMHAGQLRWLRSYLPELVANQLEMSLLKLDWLDTGTCFNDEQGRGDLVWADTLEYCQRHDIQVQAWGSLAKGWLTGAAPKEAPTRVHETQLLVTQLAQRHGVAPESLLLAWLLKHPAQIQPVIGTSNPERIRACADATRIVLSREEWYQLYVSARGHRLP